MRDLNANPHISVIITVYKRTQYLTEALRSVLDQTYENFEVIVTDDSGTAEAQHTVSAFSNDPRVRYLANPVTLGVARSLVRAFENARGEFVSILNDDDLWEPNLLTELLAGLESEIRPVIAFADHWVMHEDGTIDEMLSDRWSSAFARDSLSGGNVSSPACTAVLRRSVTINVASAWRKNAIDTSLLVAEISGAYDYFIGCLLAATGQPFYFVPKRLARWRVHQSMETHRRSHDKSENMVHIFTFLRDRDWFPELKQYIIAELSAALVVVGRDKLDFGRVLEARNCFWRAFRLSLSLKDFVRAADSSLPGFLRLTTKTCRSAISKWIARIEPDRRADTLHSFHLR